LIEDFSLSINSQGQVSVNGGSYPKAATNEAEGNNLLIVIIVIAIIATTIAIAVYMLVMRRQPAEAVEIAVMQPQGGCPSCGKQLVFMQDFGKYYCSSCNVYY
jgi:hypothetical protein